MRVTILGSGGGLGIPNPFCHCANCQAARATGGRSLRNAPAVLVNDDLLIDCGPDVINSVRQSGLLLTCLRTLVITHRHSDHLDPWFLWARGGVDQTELPLLTVYAPQDTIDYVMGFYREMMGWEQARLETRTRTLWRPVLPGTTRIAGRYRLHFFPAVHGDETMEALLVGVKDARSAYLHLYDTGPLPEATWDALAAHRFDLAALDASIGRQQDYHNTGHMTGPQVIETVARLRESGILTPEGVALATHLVHQATGTHDSEVAYYAPHGVQVAYDGLTLELGQSETALLDASSFVDGDTP
ncbi:MAG: hypothetical protein JXN59_18055 [Anaerolineae bacterium]|nr:hypothetical protein [Anaerolineae bacterium]